jgi:hypothetical protein
MKTLVLTFFLFTTQIFASTEAKDGSLFPDISFNIYGAWRTLPQLHAFGELHKTTTHGVIAYGRNLAYVEEPAYTLSFRHSHEFESANYTIYVEKFSDGTTDISVDQLPPTPPPFICHENDYGSCLRYRTTFESPYYPVGPERRRFIPRLLMAPLMYSKDPIQFNYDMVWNNFHPITVCAPRSSFCNTIFDSPYGVTLNTSSRQDSILHSIDLFGCPHPKWELTQRWESIHKTETSHACMIVGNVNDNYAALNMYNVAGFGINFNKHWVDSNIEETAAAASNSSGSPGHDLKTAKYKGGQKK